MRGWLVNRVTITFALIAAIVIGWNLYVRAHDDGVLVGQVVDANGTPVAGATVVLSEQTITSLSPIAETVTDEAGGFRFEGHDRHALVLTAEKAALGQSPRVDVRLYFRNQNRVMGTPIVIGESA